MIYFCIPSHDEAATVGLVLWKIRNVLQDSPREYQLLVGNDASTDATVEVLEQYAKALPLTVITNAERRGYAATVEALLHEALQRSDRHKRDIAVVLPADFGADPADLPEFLRKLDSGADLVVGEASIEGEPDRWHVRVRRWAPRLLGRRVAVPGVRDIVSGFFAVRLVALRQAFRDQDGRWTRVDGWAANAQWLTWLGAVARRVETVPIVERGSRRVRPHRMTAWQRARGLWAARRDLVAPPATLRTERPARTPRREQEAA